MSEKARGHYISPPHRRYSLEPGNGTHYEFAITWLAVPKDQLVKVVSGVSDGEYVTITMLDQRAAGSYEFMISALGDTNTMRYAFGKFPHTIKHDVVSILLASSVLANNPTAVEQACDKMLNADVILQRMERGER